jgi:hypothetical protein
VQIHGSVKCPDTAAGRAAKAISTYYTTNEKGSGCDTLCAANVTKPLTVGACSANIEYETTLAGGAEVASKNVTSWADCCAACFAAPKCDAW